MTNRCVPVHDKRSMTLFEAQEFITNPEKVMQRLVRQRNARAKSCMNKQEISARKTVVETIEEETMSFWKKAKQTPADLEL